MQRSMAIPVYILGTIVMISAVITGRIIQTDIEQVGIQSYLNSGGTINFGAVFYFIFGFPVGIGVCLSGMVLLRSSNKLHPLLYVGLALLSTLIILFIHKVLGVTHSPGYFGIGGLTIMVLIAVSIWYWGQYRAKTQSAFKSTTDLHAIGYLFFALAAWNLCGVGAPPGFALYPEKMMSFEPKFFAVAQMKVVMAFFVIAWLFTALGYRQAAKHNTNSQFVNEE